MRLLLQANKEHENIQHFSAKNNIFFRKLFGVMLIITQWQTVQFGSWRELSSSGIVLGRILSKGPSHHRAVSWSSPRPIRRSGCASWPMRRHEVTSPTEAGNRIQMSPNTLHSVWPSINIFYELLTEIKPVVLERGCCIHCHNESYECLLEILFPGRK